jgi:hypothetical protein
MFARWMLPKAGKKAVETIKSVRPGSDTGAKSVNYWKNKASAARIKNVVSDVSATTTKLAKTMDKTGTAMEKKIKWYQKAANKKRYSEDFYKGKK